ncbi:MAG: hypothetical protein ACKPHU_16320, partial [Planctomycetaceae bacterium]
RNRNRIPARTLDSVLPRLPLSAAIDFARDPDAMVPVLPYPDPSWQGKCTMDNSAQDRYSHSPACVVSVVRTKICISCF